MSEHDDRRITLDDVFMNQESLEQMIRDREAERRHELDLHGGIVEGRLPE